MSGCSPLLVVDEVLAVRTQGIDRADRDTVLSLLDRRHGSRARTARAA